MAKRINSKEKGKAGEREASKECSRVFGCNARRGQQYCGGTDSADIVDAIPGVHVEVKREERFRMWDAVDQANRDCGGNVPVVMHRKNRKPWVFIVELDRVPEFARLVLEGMNPTAHAGGRGG